MAAYLKGLYEFNRGDPKMAIDFARQGTGADPQAANCDELLGMSLILAADFHQTTYAAVMAEARTSLQRALAVEPNRGRSLSWLGWTYFAMDHDWERGGEQMRRGFELDPGTGNNYGFFLAAASRFEESISVVQQAIADDPANPILLADAAHILYFARRYGDAIEQYRKAIALSPSARYPRYFLAEALLLAGRAGEAFDEWMWSPDGRGPLGMGNEFRRLFASGGWQAVWRAFAEHYPRDASARFNIWALVRLSRKREAIEELEALAERRDSWTITLEDPIYDPLRQEPRFKALVERLGYPPAMWQ